jgi:DNA helicase II / ATP-dependent DNA helicase PcrA
MNNILSNIETTKYEIRKLQKLMYENEIKLIDYEKQLVDVKDMEILEKMELNDQQEEIVKSKEKNILVVACPGSGKTHTLISRYIHLVLNDKINPENIILITFTNKAGKEMNERIHNYLPNKKPYYVGSLHGLSYRLLQKYNKINYTILDDSDSKKLLKECTLSIFKTSELTDDEENSIRSQIVHIYEKIATSFPIDVNKTLEELNIKKKYKSVVNKILKEYKKTKNDQLLLDFNDLMIMLSELLYKNKMDDFLDKIQYIFFDEYQDINPIQNYILSKFNKKSNIMVVGDDAQSIYSFRGSSVQFIWDFEKNFSNTKTYYLETNYRSTKRIIKLFQNVISFNKDQYKKDVKPFTLEKGLKPQIICFPTAIDQYKWVVSEIVSKIRGGISPNDMVVLSRTNRSLENIELELVKYNIPVSKSLGRNLLEKSHIKDFIAFLIVITNDKSLIHWKRVLSLHKNIGIQKANYIIENNNDVKKSLEEVVINSEFFKKHLMNLTLLFKDLDNNRTLIQKIHLVILYLKQIYRSNGDYNIENKIDDIINLTQYFGENSIEEFIGNIYLDDFEETKMDEVLFLSTVHGAKGLEWKYVFIIDVNSNNFPMVRESFYKKEINDFEEERRIFYVATSRAKNELTISYCQNIQSSEKYSLRMSPFIRDLDEKYYLNHGVYKEKLKFNGNISEDVKNIIRFNGYNHLSIVRDLDHTRTNINSFCKTEIPIPTELRYPFVIGNFLDYLISKIIYVNFPEKVYKFELNLTKLYPKFPKKLEEKYVDKLSDWRDILDEIFDISTYRFYSSDIKLILPEYKEYLINDNIFNYYLNLEKSIVKYIKSLKPKKIQCHYNISYNNIKGECDILIDDKLFEVKATLNEACTFSNVCQVLMYGYLLNKKNININQVNIYNICTGTLDLLNTEHFDFKKFQKLIYNNN